MGRLLGVSVALVLALGSAHANDDNVVVYGMGVNSCGSYSAALSEHGPSIGIKAQGKTYYSKSAALSE